MKHAFENEFQEVIKAKELVSDDLWEKYKLLQIKGLPEQVIFEAAHKKFKEKMNAIQSKEFTNALERGSLAIG